MSVSIQDKAFDALLEHLRESRGFDFTGYKRAGLMRRITKRMQAVHAEDFATYLDHLQVHPDEFARLFDTVLINVTAFHRDASTWDYLASDVVPALLAARAPDEPIRVWSAGCATGEEAYSLAIVLAEQMGAEAFRDRVKIYATDVDEGALNHARAALYPAQSTERLSPEVRERYFEPVNGDVMFRRDLRRNVVFGRHDLIQDAPISRVDILSCRNTLMYLDAETQARILSRFQFALNDDGYLLLGKAEMLFTRDDLFTPVSMRHRIFRKAVKTGTRPRRPAFAAADSGIPGWNPLPDAVLDSVPLAILVVDTASVVRFANERCRDLFHMTAADIGRPLKDLQVSYRPLDLRSCLDQVFADPRPLVLKNVDALGIRGDIRWLDVVVTPLMDSRASILGVSFAFADVTLPRRLQADLEFANAQLEATNEELQATNEEMETTNEELQATNEELETTNEELQSANEELETMNEELQSTNEELESINAELIRRTDDLDYHNAFTDSVLASLRGGVVVTDAELRVTVWSHKAADMWGLRPEEAIGRRLAALDIGLPINALMEPMNEVLRGAVPYREQVVTATNRRGWSIACKVVCTGLAGPDGEMLGVILSTEEQASTPEVSDGHQDG